jgi:hypothetical protein
MAEEAPVKLNSGEDSLRAFAAESGLPGDSKFLSHWFGLTNTEESLGLEDSLPRPSPWNYFTPAEAKPEKEMPIESPVARPCEASLRAFVAESGLGAESKFLSHWFGLSKTDDSEPLSERLPRPSSWNYFLRMSDCDAVSYEIPEEKGEATVRAWAHESGLAGDSKFLSHWFGLSKEGASALDERLPCPSPWNYFNKMADEKGHVRLASTTSLRVWADKSGLAADSKFLSHWFGLSKAAEVIEDQLPRGLPRPSPWNLFCENSAIIDFIDTSDHEIKSESEDEDEGEFDAGAWTVAGCHF